MASSTAHYFFKIILQQTLLNKLQIPSRFLKKYCGGSLPSQVFLKLPCGSRWEVGLTKSRDGKVWMKKGWDKFAQHCSLRRGNFLVFGYEGDSEFHVIIFDTNTMEIDYPSNHPNHYEKHNVDIDEEEEEEEEEEEDDDDDDDESIEVLNSFPRYPKTRDKSPIPCSRLQKKIRTSGPVKAPTNNLSHLRKSKAKVMKKGSLPSKVDKSTPKRCQKPTSVNRNTTALERANLFESDYPFFAVIMKKYYATSLRNFHVPSWFARTYIIKKQCEASLWVSNGESWSVHYRVVGGSNAAEFREGWKAFALENSLEVGDICKFELTNSYGNEISFRVSIVKCDDDAYDDLAAKIAATPSKRNVKLESSLASDDESSMISPNIISDNEQEKFSVEDSDTDESTELISKANTGNKGTCKRPSSSRTTNHCFSENRSLKVVLRPIHLQRYKLNIPLYFAKKYLKDKTQTMTLWVGERCWDVRFLVGEKDFSFSAGWKDFTRENSLKPGDACIFKLIKGNQSELKVTIIRKSASKIATATPSKRNLMLDSSFAGNSKGRKISQNIIKKKEQKKVIAGLSDKSTNLISETNTSNNQDSPSSSSSKSSVVKRASEVASHFFSKNPSFKVTLQLDHVHGGYKLPIPSDFASHYFEEKTETISLWVGEDEYRHDVKLIVNGSEYKFSTGWAEFAMNNSLHPRDICIFELIKRSNQPEMKVNIFRQHVLYF
ncbi:hypothetical protein CsatA_014113 [Cannabis sativa]